MRSDNPCRIPPGLECPSPAQAIGLRQRMEEQACRHGYPCVRSYFQPRCIAKDLFYLP